MSDQVINLQISGGIMGFRFGSLLLALGIMALAGCAVHPQMPVDLKNDSLSTKSGITVGVVATELPKIDTNFPGANCLLCYAAAAAMNSQLTTHSHTLASEDLLSIKDAVADALRKKGLNVVVIKTPLNVEKLGDYATEGPNVAKKNYTALKDSFKVDKLIVIQLGFVGYQRNYNTYVPTAEPKAVIAGSGYLVNLTNNTYEWYQPITVMKASDGAWDEPPNYPGLTNAFFQAVELTRDSFVTPLSK